MRPIGRPARFEPKQCLARRLNLLGERAAARSRERRLFGQGRLELDEDRPLLGQESGQPPSEIAEIADCRSAPIARALGHRREVDGAPSWNLLRAGGVVDAVVEDEVRQVAGRRGRNSGQRTELHEQRAIPVWEERLRKVML